MLTGVNGVKVGHHGPNFHLEDEPEEHLRQLDVAHAEVPGRRRDHDRRRAGRRGANSTCTCASRRPDGSTCACRCTCCPPARSTRSRLGLVGRSATHISRSPASSSTPTARWRLDRLLPRRVRGRPVPHRAALPRAGGVRGAHRARRTLPGCRPRRTRSRRPPSRWSSRRDRGGARRRVPTPTPVTASSTAACRRRSRSRGWPRLGIRPVNQPQHYFNWGEGVEQAIGTPGERFNPLGEFVGRGVPVTI